MNKKVSFTIDGKKCIAEEGQYLVDAAEENGVYIPTLCHLKGVIPSGSCRICTIKSNGRFMTACTSRVRADLVIENNIEEINEFRKIILESLFVSGNHYCPSCEKSGKCILQALSYKYRIMAPRFPFVFIEKKIDATSPKIYLERNRCVLCERCVRTIKNKDNKNYFAIEGRGHEAKIVLDPELALNMTDEEALMAMNNCPVGCILKKEIGFEEPIGNRKYDTAEIGSELTIVKD